MLAFSLWRKDTFPTRLVAEGETWKIATDTRTILKILHMLGDDDLAPWHKTSLLLAWFYQNHAPRDPVAPFREFVGMGNEEKDDDEPAAPDFDYQLDAMEIYASFLHLYRIDLMQTNMHWWQFRALLHGCFAMECPLSAKIHLRKADPNKASAETQKAIAHVQIPTKQSAQEAHMNEIITQRLQQGLPIDDLFEGG